jgi:hypothetical protein
MVTRGEEEEEEEEEEEDGVFNVNSVRFVYASPPKTRKAKRVFNPIGRL